MTDGPDVAELQANLVALGDAHGLFTEPDGHFGPATAAAVERWQEHEGLTVTGSVPLGEVVFLSSRVRVDHLSLPLGEAAIPGGSPFVVSTTRPVVTVPVNPALPPVHPGERVDVRLASGQSIRASVTTVGSAITLVPLRPLPASARAGDGVQVAFPVQSVHGALTVPVSALLALAGGGYGLEVVPPAGPHHIVGVRTGLFAGGRVAVSGGGIDAGTRVVSAQ
jgi:peptidoglycan hydrolase-like protein with peptidoglycan-binding domain